MTHAFEDDEPTPATPPATSNAAPNAAPEGLVFLHQATVPNQRDLEENGAWGTFEGGIRLRLRYEGSDAVRTVVQRLGKERQALLIAGGGYMDPGVMTLDDVRIAAEVVVADWNLADPVTRQKLPATVENIARVMYEQPKLRRDAIVWHKQPGNYTGKPAGAAAPAVGGGEMAEALRTLEALQALGKS